MRGWCVAAALCAGLLGPGCSSPGSAGGFAAGGGDTDGPGPGSSGGDDAAGPGGGEGGAGDGPAASTAGDGGGGSSGGFAGTDAARDAPPADARGPEAGSTGHPDGGSSLDAVRQACVDRINMHRATVGLAPLGRAAASVEACSDRGAMQDATTNSPHSSAGMCAGTGGQDTCPSLPVGGTSGATLGSSLAQCLDQMWAEGPPPAGTSVAQCIQNYQGCFLQHGHYINMSNPMSTGVSCGFYMMSSGAFWGNQDFMP